VEPNKAAVVFAKGNFWGRTLAACASSDDPDRYYNFGPFDGLNFSLVDYGSESALEAEFKRDKNIVAFMVEPIQGEKGVVIPPAGTFLAI
jgi:ornithine--oxo-acid transaminase